jgi:hypothetical protein
MRRAIFLSVIFLIFVGQLISQDLGYRKSWALIIGINEYQSLPRLTGAVKSAKMVREKLVREFGFDPENVIELYDDQATRENILKAFDRLMDAKRVSRDDRVFVFFAGHGVTRVVGGKEKGYIMPVDGVMEKFASTAISTDQLHEFQEAIPAKHLFYVMDACYSGTIFTRGIGLRSEMFTTRAEAISKFTSRKARIAITAGSKDEQVVDLSDQGISVFTFYFLKALDGDADVDRDGIVTSSELADYVAKNVRFRAPQNPQYGRLPGDEDGEFIFVRVSGIAEQKMEPKPTPPTPVVIEEPKQRPKPVQRKPAEETKKAETIIQQPGFKNTWIYAFIGGNANIHDIKEEGVNYTKKEGGGVSVGVGFEYIPEENFSVGLNLMFDDKAGNFKIAPFSTVMSEGDVVVIIEFGPDINYDVKLSYLVLNPFVKYRFGGLYASSGLSIGFVQNKEWTLKSGYTIRDLNGEFISSGPIDQTGKIEDTKTRFSLPIALGYEMRFSDFKFFVEGRYDLGLTKIAKDTDWKVSSFQILLGLRYGF